MLSMQEIFKSDVFSARTRTACGRSSSKFDDDGGRPVQ